MNCTWLLCSFVRLYVIIDVIVELFIYGGGAVETCCKAAEKKNTKYKLSEKKFIDADIMLISNLLCNYSSSV